MVRHLKPLAIVLYVSVGLSALIAVLCFVAAGILGVADVPPTPAELDQMTTGELMGFYAGLGVFSLIMGALHFFAARDLFKMRNPRRILVLLVIGSLNLGACCTCLAPLGVLVYGLIVLLNADVKRAFEIAIQNGWNLEQTLAAYEAQRAHMPPPSAGGGGAAPPPSGGGFPPPAGGGFPPPASRPPPSRGGSLPPTGGSMPPAGGGPPPPRRPQ